MLTICVSFGLVKLPFIGNNNHSNNDENALAVPVKKRFYFY